jgi:hypothetical protein
MTGQVSKPLHDWLYFIVSQDYLSVKIDEVGVMKLSGTTDVYFKCAPLLLKRHFKLCNDGREWCIILAFFSLSL